MSVAAPLQAAPAKPQAAGRSTEQAFLHRKCACGASELAPVLPDDERRYPLVQPRLTVGASNDPLEREAERIADRVLDASVVGGVPQRIGSIAGTPSAGRDAAPASVADAIARTGDPLEPALRTDLERRFGYDFSRVRVHCDPAAARSARDVGAEAYTVGHNIVFGTGRYQPASRSGRALLAHELTHVVQQSGAAAPAVQRAEMKLGALTVKIEYGDVNSVAVGDRADKIIALATGLAGAPDAAMELVIRALPSAAQTWMMFGLQLLNDNRAVAGALGMPLAVQRLLTHAPGAAHTPLPDPDNLFVREVLSVSGWSQEALSGRLTAPGATDQAAIRAVVNPPPSSGSASDPLKVAAFKSRLRPALAHLLRTIDPAKWTKVGKRSISAFQTLGNVIQQEARSFFSPYADVAIGNLFDLRPAWHASTNIFDVGALVPNTALRISYLSNRAEIVGRSDAISTAIIDANIFADVHFDPTRPADRAELLDLVTKMEADAAIQPIVDRLIQHTGRQSGTGATATIGLVTEFNADKATACQDHWRGIDTLCHEVLHALVHPGFVATAARVSFPQIIREGFTEVLGAQLFNKKVVPKAKSDSAFKASLETGVSGAPCPAPAAATIDYGAAGSGAESIRGRVGDDNFRAAYFLGRPELAGLPT
jgi:hypothetical protein